jgi:DNA-directed RNA polymerase specialized sigma24 family protein
MLGLYGLLFAGMFLYLHSRFRTSSKILALLKTDWAVAESTHAGLVETAQEKIARLAMELPVKTQAQPVIKTVTSDTRTQVVAMGKRGVGIAEIARTTGLPEGEVDVLLGLARMER